MSYYVKHPVYDEDGYEVGYTTAPVDRDDVIFVDGDPRRSLSFTEQEADRKRKGCGVCTVCNPGWRGMYLCADCGNKRCPHATDCRLPCTCSNAPGQAGSMYALSRPCCHTTGPNHHPACQESK